MARSRMVALVSGKVQGVGYRAFVAQQARQLTLSGQAENLADGRVEVVAEGERADLDQLLHVLRRGPKFARVAQVEVMWAEPAGLVGFSVF